MNSTRFDAIVKGWGVHASRRTMLALIPTLGLGQAFAGTSADARKRKKRCKKKCGPCRKCRRRRCKPIADGKPCGDCAECQGGACTARCAGDETCLGNGSCGQTCAVDDDCTEAGCECNAGEGSDAVCRLAPLISLCEIAEECVATSDCPAGNVCTSACGEAVNRCFPLCPAA